MIIVLIGPPGAGKGTQAILLSEKYRIPHISAGGMLRKEIAKNTGLGEFLLDCINRAELVPSKVVKWMLATRIAQPDCANGFILEGYPRNIEMGRDLRDLLQEKRNHDAREIRPKSNWEIDAAFFLDVAESEVRHRIAERQAGRVDDNPAILDKRLQVFYKETVPLKHFLRGKTHVIDGGRDRESVFKEIVSVINRKVINKDTK